ncbi:PH domain-containing protein [Nocardiopsis sediminis]|uniref:PH domain-containing protein n=1 Tax=Nocardiopsis sediminis TaxID=1778267 RepID=A0ABV8FKV0_9ACTN
MTAATPVGPAPRHDPGSPAVSAEWRRLSPATVWASVALLAAVIGLPAIVATAAVALAGALVPWGLTIVTAAAALIAALAGADALRLRRTRYRVTGERMEMDSGIVARTSRSIPRERIRSVDVSAPLWARVLGLCSVTVGTGVSAGAARQDELRLDFVTAAEGARLRRELLLRGPGADAGDASGLPGTAVLAGLSPAWFGYAPLSRAVPLLGAGAIGGAWQVLSWFGEQRAVRMTLPVWEAVLAHPFVAVPALVLTVAVTGTVAATALQVEAWWNYRMTRESDGTLLVQRGLLTAKSLSVEERRLHGAEVLEPLPLRWSGGAKVAAVATGLGGGDREETVARSALSPAMPGPRARRLAAAVLNAPFSLLDTPLAAHPRAALRRRVAGALLGAAVIAAVLVGAAAVTPWVAWWAGPAAAAVAAPLLVAYAVGAYRGLGHALTPGHLVTRAGMAARATVALERDGIIGWRFTRSPMQRRAGLVTVGATTAGGSGVYRAVDMGLGEGVRLADAAVPGLLAPFLEPA